ncbi:adenosylcobinamide-phosphate synthase CbiB [Devosia lacusdianchii]|uniref:adenosylcobinamide-phosphate synthase CbiB n=1 Tax=Devosia lacusdianchii TaxID=2917991 RepID=UPI001F05A57D|nr:adenosylcobinamide-phosphate synthase CbiB [Devosia sp. JXJ CY 41]
MQAFVAPLALLVERWLGYPQRLVDLIGHPVIWMGRFITFMEKGVDKRERTPRQRRDAGIFTLAVLLIVTLAIALLVQQTLRSMPLGWALEILVATPFLAQKELGRAVEAVSTALLTSLQAGREAVSHIVGRDPDTLDEAGVARAAVETLAESTSDGVVAPWFWLVLLGLPGIALYKAINTADSMIGHMNERYRDYGWAAAKLDDLVNLIPARLSAVLVTIACFFVPGASPSKAWQAARRDARKHKSPNSGWPEAAFAGALDLSLGGPRTYDGELVDLPTMGDGDTRLGPYHIARAITLYRMTLNVLLALSLAIALLMLAA